jgi:hypothetical protein
MEYVEMGMAVLEHPVGGVQVPSDRRKTEVNDQFQLSEDSWCPGPAVENREIRCSQDEVSCRHSLHRSRGAFFTRTAKTRAGLPSASLTRRLVLMCPSTLSAPVSFRRTIAA